MNLAWIAVVLLAGAPAGKQVTIERKHQPGQKYSLAFTSADITLGTSKTFKGTATVKSAAEGKTSFDVRLSDLSWVSSSSRSAKDVALAVTVEDGSISAVIVSAGTADPSLQMELTAFEMMMGDLCRPPAEPFTVGKALNDWTLVSAKGDLATLKRKAPKDGSIASCEVKVSLADGFAGERSSTLRRKLNAKHPKTGAPLVMEQKYTLKVTRL